MKRERRYCAICHPGLLGYVKEREQQEYAINKPGLFDLHIRTHTVSAAGKEAPIINNSEAISYVRNSRLSILIARFGWDLVVFGSFLLGGRIAVRWTSSTNR